MTKEIQIDNKYCLLIYKGSLRFQRCIDCKKWCEPIYNKCISNYVNILFIEINESITKMENRLIFNECEVNKNDN